MSDQPPPLPKKKSRSTLVTLVVIVVVGLFSYVMVKAALSTIAQTFSKPKAWKTLTVYDVTLETPYPLKENKGEMGLLPDEVKDLIKSLELQTSSESNNLHVTVSRIIYTEAVEDPSLEGAVKGNISKIASNLELEKLPEYTVTPTTHLGMEGLSIVCEFKGAKTPILLRALVAKKGQTIWHVQTIYVNPSQEKEARRVIESVRINPPASLEEAPVAQP